MYAQHSCRNRKEHVATFRRPKAGQCERQRFWRRLRGSLGVEHLDLWHQLKRRRWRALVLQER